MAIIPRSLGQSKRRNGRPALHAWATSVVFVVAPTVPAFAQRPAVEAPHGVVVSVQAASAAPAAAPSPETSLIA